MSLRNKKVLITAGPTWVPIDSVRVISNIATGRTGILLAREAARQGARVTLILGPYAEYNLKKSIRLIHFRFFNELKDILKREIKNNKYDVVIHSAAVSDYKPKTCYMRKVKSNLKQWRLELVPTPKIIDLIKKIDRSVFLVGFKFEPAVKREILVGKAKSLLSRAKLDLVVANTVDKNRYRAYITNQNRLYGPLKNKDALVEQLIDLIGERL